MSFLKIILIIIGIAIAVFSGIGYLILPNCVDPSLIEWFGSGLGGVLPASVSGSLAGVVNFIISFLCPIYGLMDSIAPLWVFIIIGLAIAGITYIVGLFIKF